jgi:hypothetical protein
MSAIKVVKGFPLSALIRIKDDDTTVNVNDGTWDVSAELHYQTEKGPTPFDITLSPNGFTNLFELTVEQTNLLSHLGTGYVLVIKAYKDDNTVFIENSVPVSVVDGL